jgi:hypothetical protein
MLLSSCAPMLRQEAGSVSELILYSLFRGDVFEPGVTEESLCYYSHLNGIRRE